MRIKIRVLIKLTFIFTVILLWGIALFKIHTIFKTNNFYGRTFFSEKPQPSQEQIFFTQYINTIYSEYYDILNISVLDYSNEELNPNEYEKYYFVCIEKKLKYTSVFQIPFVAGMKAAVDANGVSQGSASDLLNLYNKRTAELKKYIGKKQTEYNIFKIVFTEKESFENVDVRIATYHKEISAQMLRPPAFDVMFKQGYDFINSGTVSSKKNSYDIDAAVAYADKYTSNPINKNFDKKFWNKNYTGYENDCANFVSQCLKAGGIEQTSLWFVDSIIWIRTGSPKTRTEGITTYMQKIGKFRLTGFSGISHGGFICLIRESHTVFVTSNDSITILFNGHTNDRKRVSFPHLDASEALYLTPI